MSMPTKEEQIRARADMYVHLFHNAIERIQRDGDDFIRKAVMDNAESAVIYIMFNPDEVVTVNFDVTYPTVLGISDGEGEQS